MKQTKTVQQHKWNGNYFHKVCTHCDVHRYKELDRPYQYAKDGQFLNELPKCITRQTAPAPEPGQTDGKTTG